MAQINKIERYGLEADALSLFKLGRDTRAIAAGLSMVMADKGIGDSISYSTVSRWLKDVRSEAKAEANQIVTEHIVGQLPSDLAAMDEIELFHLTAFRDDKRGDKDRSEFGMKALKVVETKLRFAFGGENATESGITADELAGLLARAPKGTDGHQP
jgi:hypothetical protein